MISVPEEPGATASIVRPDEPTEVEYVTWEIIDKIYQGDVDKHGAAEHIAQIAVKAVADYFGIHLDQLLAEFDATFRRSVD
jgi:hypothetical protein